MKASREFQVFAKPTGAICNLDCHYCYYVEKQELFSEVKSFRMSTDLLEKYIVQHIEASPRIDVTFSWHGGEPTILGLDYFRTIVRLQQRHCLPGRRIVNGIQTNGTLLDDGWCEFLSAEGFGVGLSLDGPREMHDAYRVTKGKKPTHKQAERAFTLLQQHGIECDILCVVHNRNVGHAAQVYQYFKKLGARFLTFLPVVRRDKESPTGVTPQSVSAEGFGRFLCNVFHEWVRQDVGKVMVQIFEEATRPSLGMDHSLCIFRETCGDIPVVEFNGDFYCCDHFVDSPHRLGNISETHLAELLESNGLRSFGLAKKRQLPLYCQKCEVLSMCNGGCPKDRFIQTPDGKEGLNYLCAGLRSFFTHIQPYLPRLVSPARGKAGVLSRQASTSLKVGRNDPCPCGSGRKFKKCCLGKC